MTKDKQNRRLYRALALTGAGLWWESVARAFWPFATLALLALAALSFGAIGALPVAARPYALILGGLVLLAALVWGAFRFRRPARDAALRRVDAVLPGRPLSALADEPVLGGDGALWRAHQAQMAERAAQARAVAPDAGMSRRDPYGLRLVGSRAYAAAAAESGWVPSPLPAIYSGASTKAYREWLAANSFEAVSTIGGSFVSDIVEDYYLTPWDLDYGRVVKFDHEFIGRAALEKMAAGPHRRKVTLVWDADDVAGLFRGLLDAEGLAPKIMEMPASHYAAYPYDMVIKDGHQVGVSITPAYSANERAWISLAIVEPGLAETGTELAVVWGEPDGGSRKPSVERHRQVSVKATVYPWPIHEASRLTYRKQD